MSLAKYSVKSSWNATRKWKKFVKNQFNRFIRRNKLKDAISSARKCKDYWD